MKKYCLILFVCVLSIQSYAQNVPFEVSLESINGNTKWYYIKINNNFLGVDKQLELFASSEEPEGDLNKYLWAFIDAGKESFYLVNRSLGNSYRLGSNSSTSTIAYGDLAVMKQGTGRKMRYKFTKNGGAGIYTKNLFNTYLGTNNRWVKFVDSSQKADIIVGFVNSESDILREIEAKEKRQAEEARKRAEEQARKQEEERIKREKIKAIPSEAFIGTWEEVEGPHPGYLHIYSKDGSLSKVMEETTLTKIGGIMCNATYRASRIKGEQWRKVDDKIIYRTTPMGGLKFKVIKIDYSGMTTSQKNKVKAGIPLFEKLSIKNGKDEWAYILEQNSSPVTWTIIELRDDYLYLDMGENHILKLRKVK